MARYTDSVCTLCRSEGVKLFLKGSRCYTTKCAVERRRYGPGQHGQDRKKLSEYATQLREKQKVRRTYLVLERPFAEYFNKATAQKKVPTGLRLLQLLEARFDNLLYRSGMCPSRKQARQLILHGHITINGKKVTIPSYHIQPGEVISVRDNSKKLVKELIEANPSPVHPNWMNVDLENLKASLVNQRSANRRVLLEITP